MAGDVAENPRENGASASPPFTGRESRLCYVCADVEFDRYLGEKIEAPIDLGPWSSICQSLRCPFCRLVTRCLESDPSLTSRMPDTRVYLDNELSWKLGIEYSPYDRSKSESYSNKFDLRSLAGKCFLDAYRFTVTAGRTIRKAEAAQQKHFGIIQYLGYKEKTWRDRQFFGRRVRAEEVDVELLRQWLATCSENHGVECARDDLPEFAPVPETVSRGDLPDNLRLIDVFRGCVVRAKDLKAPKYVALSYVWGKEEMMRETGMVPVVLKRSTISRDANGECTVLPGRLPRTIGDAMKLTNLLGYRYLWCDALCIVQDDSIAEKIPHLTNMQAIYSHSSVTIAAAAGTHVDHGLPGIGVPRRVCQHSELVKSLRLAVMFPSFSDLENSSQLLWNDRGWTFQEKLLSKRILLFTDYQVYFKCSESIWTEEIILETAHVSKSVEARPGKYRWQLNRGRDSTLSWRALRYKDYNPQLQVEDEWNYLGGFLDYAAAMHEYTRRKLGDENDTLFAISGVLETMEQVTGRFFLGLPQKHFLESLLWHPEKGSLQHYNAGSHLPTWTWASSTFERKGISFDLMDVRQLRALSDLSKRAFTKDKDDDSSDSEDDGASYAGLLGAYANLMACLSWPLLQKGLTIRRLYYCYGSRHKRIDFQTPVSTANITGLSDVAKRRARAGNDNWRPSPSARALHEHVLAFQTVIVRFRIGRSLSERTTSHDSEVGVFQLLNFYKECVGEIITTFGRARLRKGSNDFLTISWGLSLQHAEIHDSYIPRWRFSSKGEKSSLRAVLNDDHDEGLARLMTAETGFAPMFLKPLIQKYSRYIPKETMLKMESSEKPTVSGTQLFQQVYFAKKGQPRPRSLWTVANLMLVDWNGHRACRAGVGKVIHGAWREKWSQPQEVNLT